MKDYDKLINKFMRVQMPLMRLHQIYHKQHGPMGNPHRGQGRVLALLKIKQEISQKELGYLLDIRNQSLGELLTKLEKSGYITREASSEDRRVMVVKITAEGLEAVQDGVDISNEFADIFNVLNEEEQVQLGEYLDRISDAIEHKIDTGDTPEHQNRRFSHEPPAPFRLPKFSRRK